MSIGYVKANTSNNPNTSSSIDSSLISFLVPVGSVILWTTTSAPSDWLICDGSAISRSTYSALFAIISTTFGIGNGSTTFNIPDLRQRFPLGKAVSGTGSSIANTGGLIDHTHTVDPPNTTTSSDGAHTHTVDPVSTTTGTPSAIISNMSLTGFASAASSTHTHNVDIASTTSSSSGAHTHTLDVASFNAGTANPPFLVLNFIIKT